MKKWVWVSAIIFVNLAAIAILAVVILLVLIHLVKKAVESVLYGI